ncbi:MAG: electron transfer flavoprotein subunit beta, partial [Omnitrophica WOR_2 bacterium]
LEQERVTRWDANALDADPDLIGLAGSPTAVTELAAASTRQRKRIFLVGSPEEVARQLIAIFEEIR